MKTKVDFNLFKQSYKYSSMQMMTDVEDEDDWATSDELADDDNDSNAVVAESALDRYSFSTSL